MAVIRQILKAPHRGLWGMVTRAGTRNSRILPLDGTSISGLVAETDLGPVFQVASTALDVNRATTGINQGQEQGKFRRFPVRVSGPVIPAASGGNYEILSLTTAPAPAAVQAPSPRQITHSHNPVAGVSARANAQARAAAHEKALTESELRVTDGTPAISVQKMGLFLDALPTHRSLMFWGPPGCGKSMGIHDWCQSKGKKLFDVRLPLLDPIDLRGIGVPDLPNNMCRWLPAEFIPKEPNCVLFLDEISAAPPAVQAAAYQLTLDRKIGETTLPPDCRVIAAGNRDSDRGVAYRMPSPLANRFMHFTIETKIGDWRSWAFREEVDPRIISYLMLHPDMLHRMDEASSGQAWPSPRSWQFASEALESSMPESYMAVAVAACVGVKAAKDFVKHSRDYEKVSKLIPLILRGGPTTTQKVMDLPSCQTMACALICNCEEDANQLNNAVRWALSQNGEWRALTVKGLEDRFGLEAMNELPAYPEYLNPSSVPNPSGASRKRPESTPPPGF